MEQEGHASASRICKIEEEEITQDSTVQNMDDNPVDKSVCSSVVDLSDDAWLLVFSYLGIVDKTKIARVNTRWRQLSRISWKSITRLSFEDTKNKFIGTSDLPEVCLQQCGTRLQCLDLTYAILRGYHITPRFQNLVGLHSASLQELNLYGSDLDNTALKTLAEKLPRLRSLSLRHCNNIDEDGLGPTLKMLQSLKSLNVAYNKKITGEFFSQAPQSLTEVLAKRCDNLADKGVRVLTERCPNLEAIDISYCQAKLSGQSIRHLKNCPKLKRFKSFLSKIIWDESTFVTLFNLPLLEELDVNPYTIMTDQLFWELSRRCPRLTAISFWGCENLTDAAFFHLCPWLHLESINLNCWTQITDSGLIQLSSTHSQLKEVCLGNCWCISDEGVGRLVSDHPNLLELDITGCIRVTDGVLPMLESSLQRRQHTQPLEIWLRGTLISSETADVLRKNTRCIVYHGPPTGR